MLSLSLLGGLDADFTNKFATGPMIYTQALTPTSTAMAPGTCSSDGAYIWALTTDGVGYWRRKMASEQCTATGTTTVNTRDHTGENAVPQGGVTVLDPFGNVVDPGKVAVPPVIDLGTANLRDGRASMLEVGPFRFSADVERQAFWWSPNRGPLPADYQAAIGHAWKFGGDDKIVMNMYPALAAMFTEAPATFDARFVGMAITRPPLDPGWAPILRAKHPTSGKDYGLFVCTVSEDGSKAASDPTNKMALYFIWAPIKKAWYERLWDWIVEVVCKIVDYVCGKLSDPTVAAATTAAATAAGGPVTAGVVGGVTLLCQKPPPEAPAIEELPPAITPKLVWPYYLAGGLALLGVVAFILAPPKKKAA